MAFPLDLRHLPVICASLAKRGRDGLWAREASIDSQDQAAQALAAWRNILLGLEPQEWTDLSSQEAFWQNCLDWLPYLDHDSAKPRQGWWKGPYPAPLAMEADLWRDLGVDVSAAGVSELPLLALLQHANPFAVSKDLGEQVIKGVVGKAATHLFEALLQMPGAPSIDDIIRWSYRSDESPLLFSLLSQNYTPQPHRTILDVVLEQHSTDGVLDNKGEGATFHASSALLKKLLRAGADVNARCPNGLLLESHWAENHSSESALDRYETARQFRSPEQDLRVREELGVAMLRHGDFDLARKAGLILPEGRIPQYAVGDRTMWPLGAVCDSLLNDKHYRTSQKASSVLGLLAPSHIGKLGLLESHPGVPDAALAAVALLSCKRDVYDERKKKITEGVSKTFSRLSPPQEGWAVAMANAMAQVSSGWAVSEALYHWHTDGKSFGVELSADLLPELLPALKQQLVAIWKDSGLVKVDNSVSTSRQYNVACTVTSGASNSSLPPMDLWEIALPWALYEICRLPASAPRPMMGLAVSQFALLPRITQASAFNDVLKALPEDAQKMLQSHGAALVSALRAAHLQNILDAEPVSPRQRPRM